MLTYTDMDFKKELGITIDRLENGILDHNEKDYLRKLKQSIESIESRNNKEKFFFISVDTKAIYNYTVIDSLVIYGALFLVCVLKNNNVIYIEDYYRQGYKRLNFYGSSRNVYKYIKEEKELN